MMLPGIAHCQSYTLPSILFDSLVFEVAKGRQCERLTIKQDSLITFQADQISQSNKAIQLLTDKNSAQADIISGWTNELYLTNQKHDLEKRWLKKQLKRVWAYVVLEGGAIVVLVILLI